MVYMCLFAARCHVRRNLHTMHLVPKQKLHPQANAVLGHTHSWTMPLTPHSTTEDASHLLTSFNSVSRIPWARCPRADSVVCIDDNNCWALVGL
jgi:hypothetical protein